MIMYLLYLDTFFFLRKIKMKTEKWEGVERESAQKQNNYE